MRHSSVFALLLLLLAVGVAQADEQPKLTGEIRIYLADSKKKPATLDGIRAMALVEPKGGKRKLFQCKVVRPKGSKKTGIGHGGEVRPMEGGYLVELVVVAPHAGHEKKQTTDATPYFMVKVPLKGYQCGMAGHPFTAKPGKCTKCPMQCTLRDREFRVVLIFRIGSTSHNVKGFEHPPAVPKTYPLAVAKIDKHMREIRALIDGGNLEQVHPVAEKISRIARKLPSMAPKAQLAEIKQTCSELVGLFAEIDKAADSNNKPATETAFAKYTVRVQILYKSLKATPEK